MSKRISVIAVLVIALGVPGAIMLSKTLTDYVPAALYPSKSMGSFEFKNVEKAMEHKIYENEEIKNIFTALGVSITENDEGDIEV